MVPVFNAEMKELVAAGATYLQMEDLGAWLPLFTGNKDDYKWIRESVEMCCDGVDAKIGWHFCFGNAWGNDILSANYPEGYQTVLPYFFETKGIDEFVLDYANRDMSGIEFLAKLPADKDVQVGVLDIRTMMVESPEQVAGRARKVLEHVPADRVTLSTDCGMKPLPRTIARMKLKALVEGAAIVRGEL
jgi:5-methyltetrahydropteroyltriglutamate--homocysteine methyltransferase